MTIRFCVVATDAIIIDCVGYATTAVASRFLMRGSKSGSAGSGVVRKARGAGRNRTDESRFCRPLPYHLATAPGRQKSPKHAGFSTPQGLHQFCRACEYLLILLTQMRDASPQSLDPARASFLQQSPSRRRGLDQLHSAIAGVTHATHKPSPF